MFIMTDDCGSSDHTQCLGSKDTSPQNDIKREVKVTSIEMHKESFRNYGITKGRDFNYFSWVCFSLIFLEIL